MTDRNPRPSGRGGCQNGSPAGYAKSPLEVVNYVSKHDNQTLWDNHQYKLADSLTADQRVQMQVLSQALPILSQGVPFIHMGVELLRSKSMQRDSYDSGDWFNKVDFDLKDGWDNNWNKGLPRFDKDGDNWDLIKTITENGKIKVNHEQGKLAKELVMEYIRIRKSSPLFRLTRLEDVQKVVKFHNTGSKQDRGLIVMELDGDAASVKSGSLIVLANATAQEVKYKLDDVAGYTLHDVQKNSVSAVLTSSPP